MKRFFLAAVIILLLFTVSSAAWYVNKLHHNNKPSIHIASLPVIDNAATAKINTMARQAAQYASTKKMNTQFCFLIDMTIASGRQRFFVYDMKKQTIIKSGLVTHGRCNENWLTGRKYDNAIGCGCTSLGKYKVGNAYNGKFGLAYKLYGLEAANSNAYNRFVVLHSMQCVPEAAVDPYPICQSDGCPTVSPGFLKELSPMINASKQPVLLWIFG